MDMVNVGFGCHGGAYMTAPVVVCSGPLVELATAVLGFEDVVQHADADSLMFTNISHVLAPSRLDALLCISVIVSSKLAIRSE